MVILINRESTKSRQKYRRKHYLLARVLVRRVEVMYHGHVQGYYKKKVAPFIVNGCNKGGRMNRSFLMPQAL